MTKLQMETADELGLTEQEIQEAWNFDEAYCNFEINVYEIYEQGQGLRYFAEYSNGQIIDRGFIGNTAQEAIDFVIPMIRDEANKIEKEKAMADKFMVILVDFKGHEHQYPAESIEYARMAAERMSGTFDAKFDDDIKCESGKVVCGDKVIGSFQFGRNWNQWIWRA